MLLFSSALRKHKLTFNKLSNCIQYLSIAAQWAEDEWGYIRNKGIEYRKTVIAECKENMYIGCFAGKPVAMFALFDHPLHPELSTMIGSPKACELMYVYIKKEMLK